MGFLEHLDELRTRIIRAFIALGVGTLVAFVFVDRLADFVLAPTLRALPPGSSLIFTKPGEAFSLYLDIALIGGVVLAAPFAMYQLWRFIAPGLYARERQFIVPFAVLTSAGSIAGALFAHYVLYPGMIRFFAVFKPSYLTFMPRVEDTFDLYKNTVIGMVLVFQIPALVFFLAKMRLVTARMLWRNFKYAILGIFIIAAVLTPSTDPWNQTVFAAPMVALYLVGIVVAWIVAPKDRATRRPTDSTTLRLVFAATVADTFRKRLVPSSRPFLRRVR